MNRILKFHTLIFVGAAALLFLETASAQTFVYHNNDLALGFRKTGSFADKYEVVVNLGQASNYFGAPIGTTFAVTNYSAAQLTPGTFVNLSNLSWSVFGYYSGSGFGASYPSTVASTLWITIPRASSAVRSGDATRLDKGTQTNVRSPITSIFANASFVSGDLGTASQYNTASFIREDASAYGLHLLSVWMGSVVDLTIGTLNDAWPEGNIENRTPASFTAPGRSDLYEVRPLADSQGNPIVDPHTGTNGLAWYIGYFEFKTDGTMTFTREAASTTPTPPVLTIARTNNASVISFVSSASATYRLFFTNSAGLSAPVTNWPSLSGTIVGDGTKKTFQDTTTDPLRLYRVQGQ